MATVVVTGAAGGLGSNVVEAAVLAGHEVRAVVRRAGRTRFPDGVRVIEADAGDPVALARALDGAAALYHMVNVSFDADWMAATRRLLDVAIAACAASGARLVFPGNVWIYGRGRPGDRVPEDRVPSPCSTKGAARLAKERALEASGARFVIVRLPEFYGPHVATLTGPPLLRVSTGRTATWFGPGDAEVEFVYMPDAARALVTIGVADGVDGARFHVAGVEPTTPRRFFARAIEVAGGGSLRVVPAWVPRVASPFSAMARGFADILHLWEHPVLLDGSAVHARFPGLRATPYEEGLRETIAWLRANPGAKMYF